MDLRLDAKLITIVISDLGSGKLDSVVRADHYRPESVKYIERGCRAEISAALNAAILKLYGLYRVRQIRFQSRVSALHIKADR